jgi:hypothetical protein
MQTNFYEALHPIVAVGGREILLTALIEQSGFPQ